MGGRGYSEGGIVLETTSWLVSSNWPVCENLKINVQNLSSELNNPQQAQQLREEDDKNGKASCQVACDWWVTPCWPITDMVSLLLLDTPLYS